MKHGGVWLGVFWLLTPVGAGAGQSVVVLGEPGPSVILTGNPRADLFPAGAVDAPPAVQGDLPGTSGHKSPWLAAGLSLAVPGAGEFYAESYWKAAAFFAVEVAAWSVAYAYDKKGDRQTDLFQGYAQQHWSARRYAEWTLTNARTINSGVDPTEYADVLVGPGDVNWDRLNQLERELGNWYSHSLPRFGEQQYYELIGKYQQFYQGWDDADPNLTTYGEITGRLAAGGTRFKYYSGERGKANDFYSTASTAVTIAIVNHILSAIDAAWSAGSYNSVHASVGMQTLPLGGGSARVPVATLSYSF